MAIRTKKPTSAGSRFVTYKTYEELTKDAVAPKSLLTTVKKTGGRIAQGKITVRNIGGANRRKYRVIDFKRNKDGVMAKVESIQYDPNRTAYIALLSYADGEKRFIIAPQGLNVGDKVMSGAGAEIKPGNALPLSEIPLGAKIHNIELQPGKGGQMVRSAGLSAQLMAKDGGYALSLKKQKSLHLRPNDHAFRTFQTVPSSLVTCSIFLSENARPSWGGGHG